MAKPPMAMAIWQLGNHPPQHFFAKGSRLASLLCSPAGTFTLHRKTLLALGLGVVLSACGGGGGGGSSETTSSNQPLPPSSPRSSQTVDSDQEITKAIAQGIIKALTDSESSNPESDPSELAQNRQGQTFGSLFDATLTEFARVTDVSTSFNGELVDLTIDRSDGTTHVHKYIENSSHSHSFDAFYNNYSYFQHTLLYSYVGADSEGGVEGQVSSAEIRVHHHDDDYTDYIAFGYWLGVIITPSDPVAGLEVGWFAEGPDFEDPASLPLSGTATYFGDFIGFFVHENNTQTIYQTGSYEGSIDLDVDFENNTIEGCVGCSYSTLIDAELIDTDSGDIQEYTDLESDYYAELNSTTLESNGQWIGNSINVQADGQSITTTDGAWAGRMSTLNDDDGVPYEAIGTAWAAWEDDHGTGAIGGAFMAVSDESDETE